ncbi:uncharacterized protein J4E92_006336 [Alternaria infectoria]|uniref:uncharacterized protein n=1 Tax=Alternaria infectoria TaxID=45303 RepID=UPI0022205CF9|nr:uncharacterized protein J4E92_006336 [Alternaria infectoria]KAI4927171.1 hypothetical protein J4E92_006336 [Alternaria infectoria]
MSGTSTSLFGGDAPSSPANKDVASAVKMPSVPDAPLSDVDSFASELGSLALAIQAVDDTARVAHDADLVAGRAVQAARVEAIIARKAKEAVAALFTSQLKGKSKSHSTLGDNPCTWYDIKQSLSKKQDKNDKPAAVTKGVLSLPFEVFGEIGHHLSVTDLNDMRLVNSRMKEAVAFPYGKKISVTENIVIFPTFASVSAFLIRLGLEEAYPGTVRTITLVGEGPTTPELGYNYAWENLHILKFPGMPEPTEDQLYEDEEILEFANDEHKHWSRANESFCHTGAYRTMLSLVLAKLPNLKTIQVRKLYPGEHIPGWAGPEALEKMSSYHPWTPVNEIYYGDWKYDEVHKRVTMWIDEYGEEMEEDDAGPQAGFEEDLYAAMALSGTKAQVFEMHKELV